MATPEPYQAVLQGLPAYTVVCGKSDGHDSLKLNFAENDLKRVVTDAQLGLKAAGWAVIDRSGEGFGTLVAERDEQTLDLSINTRAPAPTAAASPAA